MKKHEPELGRKIGRHRRLFGLSQARLAEAVGIQPETISRIETGATTPSLQLTSRISEALDLKLHELLHLRQGAPKDHALEKLIQFASRLSVAEIELVIAVGASAVKHVRSESPR